jgi:hypothetical protein
MIIEEVDSRHKRTTTEESEGARGILLGPAAEAATRIQGGHTERR